MGERSWQRPVLLVGVIAVGIAVGATFAGAAPTPPVSTTDVTYLPLSVPHIAVPDKSIAANRTYSAVVAGGATSVPTNATAVQLTLQVSGAKAGTIAIYPAGNPSGGSGQSVSYPAGHDVVGAVVEENIGESDELSFVNNGAGIASVSATITGYSTQVTAGSINGTGGSAGQVLTDTGSGAAWAPVSQGYESHSQTSSALPFTSSVLDSVTVPAGSYEVADSFLAGASKTGTVDCWIEAPNGAEGPIALAGIAAPVGDVFVGSATAQTLLVTPGGQVSFVCAASEEVVAAHAYVVDDLVVTSVGSVQGTVLTG